MDFRDNIVLKENYAFIVADDEGQIGSEEKGFYHRDTRFLSRYAWDFGEAQSLLVETPRPDELLSHHARIEGPSQLVAFRRRLTIGGLGFEDRVSLENTSGERRTVKTRLALAADFADMFEARGWHAAERRTPVVEIARDRVTWRYTANDGLEVGTSVAFAPAPARLDEDAAHFAVELAPGASVELIVRVHADHPLEHPATGPSYESWRDRFALDAVQAQDREVMEQAVDDLRALLLFTEEGPLLAAGIPWFVAAFGRDAIIAALMTVDEAPDVAEGTLRYLAARQGQGYDDVRAEAPGKIMHELRFGELSRTGITPFNPYYGTVDATPLWIVLLYETWKRTGSRKLLDDLAEPLEAALAWMVQDGDIDGDGFLEFTPGKEGEGLVVQSWKDSHDSMSHADGTLAQGALAVCEVQGYAYAAYVAAAEMAEATGDAAAAGAWRDRADGLRRAFHEAYWLDDMGTYAMALDDGKQALRVHSSGAGQLLWTGIVPEGVAPRLVETLFSDENFSGWGIRTLGRSERRYNPVSYHNGSVWPHDTALIAGGLDRYGFHERAHVLRQVLFDLAATQADRRLPELVAGYPRERSGDGSRREIPPVPYPVACRPQAWDAAALVYLRRLARDRQERAS